MKLDIGLAGSFRQITSDFLAELVQQLENGRHIALIAPRQSGKAALLYELKRRGDEMEGVDQPRTLILRALDFRDNDEQTFLREFARRLGLPHQFASEAPSGQLSESLRLAITLATRRDPRPLWLFVQNIAEFSWPHARAILEALHALADSMTSRKFAAVVTGNQGIIPLTYHENSPYRHAEKYFLIGFDADLSHRYYLARSAGITLDHGFELPDSDSIHPLDAKANEYLFEMTGGYALFIDEVRRTLTRASAPASRTVPATADMKQLLEDATHRFIAEFMDFDVYCKLSLRDVQRDCDSWKQLQRLLFQSDQPQPVSGTQPQLLETAGIMRRNRRGVAEFSSPIWRGYLDKRLTPRYRADVYAIQGEWDEAWKLYDLARNTSSCERPLDGEDRYLLNRVLKSWEESLIDAASDSSALVVRRFERGVRRLFGCDSFALYDWNTKQILHAYPTSTSWNDSGDFNERHQQFGSVARIGEARKALHSTPDSSLAIPRIGASPELRLTRHDSHPFDSSTVDRIQRSLGRFWHAFIAAKRVEYDATLGALREKHLKVVDQVNRVLAHHTSDVKQVVDETVSALLDVAGYYRVLICLVTADGRRIQGVRSGCRDHRLDFNFQTDYSLEPDSDPATWDIQQWVAIYGKVSQVPNASLASQRLPCTQHRKVREIGMEAICVVPIKVKRSFQTCEEVLGTIHLERGDKKPMSDEEMTLCQILAGQLAVAFDHVRRLSMLEKSLAVLRDEFTIISPDGRIVYRNHEATPGSATAGWTFPLTRIHHPQLRQSSIDSLALENKLFKTPQNNYVRDSTNGQLTAKDVFCAPITDFRSDIKRPLQADGHVGYVRLSHDISDILRANEAFRDWLHAGSSAAVADKILQHFRDLGYPWCRIYLFPNQDAQLRHLESYREYGIPDPAQAAAFRRGEIRVAEGDRGEQATFLLEDHRDLALLIYDDTIIGKPQQDNTHEKGIPVFRTRDSFRDRFGKVDPQWLEAPLLVGDKKIGLIALSLPPSPHSLTPDTFEKLRGIMANAATALYYSRDTEYRVAVKQAQTVRLVASQALHQLLSSLKPCTSHLAYIRQDLESLKAPDSPRISRILAQLDKADHSLEDSFAILGDFDRYALDRELKDLRWMDLNDLLFSAEHVARHTHPQVSLTIDYPTKQVVVWASPSAMAEVFGILITNSVMHAGRELRDLRLNITVRTITRAGARTAPDESETQIVFEDNGKGISGVDLDRIFEPLHTTHAQGKGLGLAVARQFLTKQRGWIAATPKSLGAQFVVTLNRRTK